MTLPLFSKWKCQHSSFRRTIWCLIITARVKCQRILYSCVCESNSSVLCFHQFFGNSNNGLFSSDVVMLWARAKFSFKMKTTRALCWVERIRISSGASFIRKTWQKSIKTRFRKAGSVKRAPIPCHLLPNPSPDRFVQIWQITRSSRPGAIFWRHARFGPILDADKLWPLSTRKQFLYQRHHAWLDSNVLFVTTISFDFN